MELWNSIDHEKTIADAENGKIYLTMEANGNGTTGSMTSVYNEYMIVAWMAKNANSDANSPAHILWNKFYADPDNLPSTELYGNYALTDRPGYFLSSFTHQFNYYLCNYFTSSEKYIEYFKQAQKADYDWWKYRASGQDWEWGCGAGSDPDGYRADKINDNPKQIVSPHIVAGFLPVYPEGENDLRDIWLSQKGRYVFPIYSSDVLLWRYSLQNPQWKATEVQGIDYSSMLFGLASLPQFLGKSFFERNNNFFSDSETKNSSFTKNTNEGIRLLTNPVDDTLKFEFLDFFGEKLDVEVLNVRQQIVFSSNVEINSLNSSENISVSNFVSGLYILRISLNGKTLAVKKFVKK